MQKTPNSLRKHVVILGNTNVGKSTLFNALTEQDSSIVSHESGTTTDPVRTAIELIPFGPIVLIDTAGINDTSSLGIERIKRTKTVSRRADAAIYVVQADNFDEAAYSEFLTQGMPHLVAITKCDTISGDSVRNLVTAFKSSVCLYKCDSEGISELREKLVQLLSDQSPEDTTLIGDLLKSGSTIVMVVPIDSEAPKGRLILPQVQFLRDALDHGMKCLVTKDTELEESLKCLKKVDLVVTDSQVFGYVNERVPQEIPITSFSMLLARQKGDFLQLLEGVKAVKQLQDKARILMLEGCTHNHTHEDIGRVKIPALLTKKTGKNFKFDYYSGYDFPESLEKYDLAIQCGSCMINQREIGVRLSQMEQNELPVTNYGILLAYLSGVLDRSIEIFGEDVIR